MSVRKQDAVIVGAGFAGLYMLHSLRGLGLDAQVFEAGSGVGGTWFWNRYPGARCDIESMEYSYQFSEVLQQEWEWSERYATQPEILNYINTVADRFDLRKDIQFDTRVVAAYFDEDSNRWLVTTDNGDQVSAQYLIMATGCLSSANIPDFDGIDSFNGEQYHTGQWPHDPVDFSGKRVAVIGTGSSGIQCIPLIAQQAKQLTVFQRTPNYSVPAHNKPLSPEYVESMKKRYSEFRAANKLTAFHANFGYGETNAVDAGAEEREEEFERRWAHGGLPFLASYADLMFNPEANELAADFIRRKIKETVRDPELAAKLAPTGLVGCKRLCADTNYFDTFNCEHVSLVDLLESPIKHLTETGIKTTDNEYHVDSIVFATGFDAMTGALLNIDIRGIRQQPLAEAWAEGPKTFLGLSVAGFPNLFTITGPGSPSVLTNMIGSIEHHVELICDCIKHVNNRGLARIEATPRAQENWVEHVNEVGDISIYPHCNSWYMGANIPGKPRVFMPYLGFDNYAAHCQNVVNNNFEGFVIS
jgi:cation diffusion facilitator CzcD-associated flavoprotein CzcO